MPILVQLSDNVISQKFKLSEFKLNIGRSTDNDIQIDDSAVSSHHAWIEPNRDESNVVTGYKLVDLNSTNGSFINEKKVAEEVLRHNDRIRIGWVNFKYIDENAETFEETTKVHKTWIPGVFYTK